MLITIRYNSIDGYSQTRRYATLAAARRFAWKWVGETPEIGWPEYAVSPDGVGRVTWAGCAAEDLFPKCFAESGDNR